MVREKGARGVEGAQAAGAAADQQPSQQNVPLMRLAPGERFFKFYILTKPGKTDQERVEHRIISKERVDGTLEMVSYNAWYADGRSEKSDVIRVPSLSKDLLEQLVQRVREQSGVPPESFREIDLSQCATVEDQLRVLARLGI